MTLTRVPPMESERGSVVPLMALVMGAAVVAMALLVEMAVVMVNRAEAQTAADLAALAAVYEGRAGAVDIAERNGVELVGFGQTDGVFWVEVALGRVRAEAWAELGWETIPLDG